jgi:uncharacterized protein (DUF934 family)
MMAILIRTHGNAPAVEKDHWAMLQAGAGAEVFPALRAKHVLLPLGLYLHEEDEARSQLAGVGVWLDSHEQAEVLADRLERLPIIAINFPVFSDGRGYTLARALRELGFAGEIRAQGDVLRDQLCFMQRCGFDSFALRKDQDTEDCLAAFEDFSASYTATTQQPQPLFHRRS